MTVTVVLTRWWHVDLCRVASALSRPRLPEESELTDLVQEFFAKSCAQQGCALNYSAGIYTPFRGSPDARVSTVHMQDREKGPIMASESIAAIPEVTAEDRGLKREVGIIGLIWSSEGSIIGSGWLFGALFAAQAAGPAAVLSWITATIAVIVIAIVLSELGAMYPVAGGTGRFPHYAYGSAAGRRAVRRARDDPRAWLARHNPLHPFTSTRSSRPPVPA